MKLLNRTKCCWNYTSRQRCQSLYDHCVFWNCEKFISESFFVYHFIL